MQNITSDHKSGNARASSCDFLFIIFSTILFWYNILATFYRALHARTLQFSGWHSVLSLSSDKLSTRSVLLSKVFWILEFSFSCSTSLWFQIAKRLSAILVLFSNLALAGVSIATSVWHSITQNALYNLFVHLQLSNHKQDILLRI